MSESIAFISGRFPHHPGPIGRFLPPIPEGIAQTWLSRLHLKGSWILDPFGIAPQLIVESAQSGCRVLVAANNPISRFLLEMYAHPPSKNELHSALADLAVSTKGSERIEPHIRSLYMTECAQCGRQVEAQAFIWERDNSAPSGRIYHCANCKDSGERPASNADSERAARFSATGLHRARALERVTPLDDPDRTYVEDALSMYLPRTVYSLFTLINKLDSFPPNRRRLLEALFLATFDQVNVLWSYPSGRSRPRQLIAPTRFLERNVWITLEQTIDTWISSLYNDSGGTSPTPLSIWPAYPPQTGGICLYEGPLRDLVNQMKQKADPDIQPAAVITALPRPNQAYWTLSALWAGWLWGHQASAPFKSVLRRRRYDWSWHTVALHAAFYHLGQVLKPLTPIMGLIGELEPGFLTAAAIATDISEFDLIGFSLRSGINQAQVQWRRALLPSEDSRDQPVRDDNAIDQSQVLAHCRQYAQDYLFQRGEPASYMQLYAASLEALVKSRQLTSTPLQNDTKLMHLTEAIIQETFSQRGSFSRYAGSSRSLDVGYWWLDKTSEERSSSLIQPPLSDRIELKIVQYLQQNPNKSLAEIDSAICSAFPGMLTPDLDLIEECLHSYGEQKPIDSGRWVLRKQDSFSLRQLDMESIESLIEKIGKQFQYRVERQPIGVSIFDREPIIWKDTDDSLAYTFYVTASAVFGQIVYSIKSSRYVSNESVSEKYPGNILVLPGGRSNLVEYKLQHDPRLKSYVDGNWRFVKFRHIRWLAESEILNRENFDEQLDRDPPANRDPQLPLL